MHDPRQPGIDPTKLLIAAVIGLALFFVAGLVFGQALSAGTKFERREALAISQAAVGKPIGDYTLFDRDGKLVRLAEYRGKPYIVSFIYTGCTQVCPTTTKFLGSAVEEAQRALGADTFRVVTVGFNMPFDTPAAMREFQRKQGIDLANWVFVAGVPATIDGLARDTGFAWVPSASGFDHLTQATIVDAQGRVFQQVYGETFELPMFVRPLKELADGTPAPVQNLSDIIERVRVLCTVYDPRAGKYRLNYGLFIEIFVGLAVLGATLYYLGSEWRRQRRVRCNQRA
jgi:protein SCO1